MRLSSPALEFLHSMGVLWFGHAAVLLFFLVSGYAMYYRQACRLATAVLPAMAAAAFGHIQGAAVAVVVLRQPAQSGNGESDCPDSVVGGDRLVGHAGRQAIVRRGITVGAVAKFPVAGGVPSVAQPPVIAAGGIAAPASQAGAKLLLERGATAGEAVDERADRTQALARVYVNRVQRGRLRMDGDSGLRSSDEGRGREIRRRCCCPSSRERITGRKSNDG